MRKKEITRMGLVCIIIVGLLLFLAPGAWAQQGKPTPAKQGQSKVDKPDNQAPLKQGKKDSENQAIQPTEAPLSPQDVLVIEFNEPCKPLDPKANDYVVRFPISPNGYQEVNALFVGLGGFTLAAPVPAKAMPGKVEVKKGDAVIRQVDFTPFNKTNKTWELEEWEPEIIFVIFMLFLIILVLRLAFDKKWSIRDALSEYLETEETYDKTKTEKAVIKVLKPTLSSSRLIAFIGFASIITWLMMVLIPAVHWFARTGMVPKLGDLSTFLVAQAGIFSPYIANRIGAGIKRS